MAYSFALLSESDRPFAPWPRAASTRWFSRPFVTDGRWSHGPPNTAPMALVAAPATRNPMMTLTANTPNSAARAAAAAAMPLRGPAAFDGET